MTTRSKKWWGVIVTAITIALVAGVGAIFLFARYANERAEQHARAFCDAIAVGSNVATAVEKARVEKIIWGSSHSYRFWFPGAFFDKAVCEVDVTDQRIVLGKSWELLRD